MTVNESSATTLLNDSGQSKAPFFVSFSLLLITVRSAHPPPPKKWKNISKGKSVWILLWLLLDKMNVQDSMNGETVTKRNKK